MNPPKPYVSILIAARNEAEHLPACLHSLVAQNYPTEKIEVLIGDDRSSDATPEIAQSFAQRYPHIRCLSIATDQAGLRAKANVLYQLARQAQGQWLLVTDADTVLPPDWIAGILQKPYKPQLGIRTALTLPTGENTFAQVQCLDWLTALSINHWASQQGKPLAAMGNNMLVRAAAYHAIGGYAAIPFSITEDFALFRALLQAGWQYESFLKAQTLVRTRAEKDFFALLRQRRRWIRGAFEVGGVGVWAGVLACVQVVVWVLVVIQLPLLGSGLLGLLWFIWGLGLWLLCRRLALDEIRLSVIWFYPPYALLMYGVFLVDYLLTFKKGIYWRDRVVI